MTPADGLRRALRHIWHPALREVMLDDATAHDRPISARVVSEDVVIARLGESVVAFPDRCLHRSLPLSAGSLSDGCLRCIGHGWQWSAEGRCVSIPDLAARAIPSRARLESLDVAVAHGLVWVRLETLASATPPALAVSLLDEPQFDAKAGAARIMDLLLDPKRWTRLLALGDAPIAEVRLGDHRAGAVDAKARAGEWEVDVAVQVPFVATFRARRGGPGRTTEERCLAMAVAPLDDRVSRVFWHASASDLDALRRAFTTVVQADATLLAHADAGAPMFAPGVELSVPNDATSVAYRRAMADLVAAARQGPGPLSALLRSA